TQVSTFSSGHAPAHCKTPRHDSRLGIVPSSGAPAKPAAPPSSRAPADEEPGAPPSSRAPASEELDEPPWSRAPADEEPDAPPLSALASSDASCVQPTASIKVPIVVARVQVRNAIRGPY